MRNLLFIGNTTTVRLVKEGTFRYVEQVCEEGIGIRFGGAFSSYIEAEAFYMSGAVTEVNEGDVIWYYQQHDVDNTFSPIDPPSITLIGKFTVLECTRGKNSYKFVAYDNMQALNIDFSGELLSMKSSFPMHVSDFLDAIAAFMSSRGVDVYVSEWGGYTAEDDSGEPVMLDYFYVNGITVRDILSYFANLTFQYVKCRDSGQIDFLFYSTDARFQTRYWLNSDRYIIAPTDQQTYTGEYIDPDTGLPVTGTLIPVFYKENGLKRGGYQFAECDGFDIYDTYGDLVYGMYEQNPQNIYTVADNIIASRIVVPYNTVWDYISYVGYQNLVDMTANRGIYPIEVHLFPFRNPYGAGCIIPHIADSDGNRYQSVVMKMELTDSEVVLTCSGPEYYYKDASKNNDVAGTTNAIAAELNNKVSKSGDTINGVLTVNSLVDIRRSGSSGNGLAIDDTSADSTVAPGSDTNRLPLVFRDKNNVIMATVRARQLADGKNGVYMYGSNNGQNNYLLLTIDSSGNKGVALNAQAEWLSALGLSVSNTSVVSDIASAGTSCTISAADFAQQGKVAQLRIVWSRSASVASGNTTIAVLASGKRPIFNALATCHTNHDLVAYVNANGNVVVNGPITAGSSYTLYATYILA